MMKTEKTDTNGLVRAAQLAGAEDSASEEFWRQVAAHAGVKREAAAKLVQPRNLTERPKTGTI